MIVILQCALPIDHSQGDLEKKIRSVLKLKKDEPIDYRIKRRSLDARKKPHLFYVYQIYVRHPQEKRLVAALHNPSVIIKEDRPYRLPELPSEGKMRARPIVIGSGPAGLFAAFALTEAGWPPIVLERGKTLAARREDVREFWETGELKAESNVQFGEGGAGTFSDGKLHTSDKDKSGRIDFVLETLVRFGAPEEILYEQNPHIGTDRFAGVIEEMRTFLTAKGCEFRFETKAKDFIIEGGQIRRILCQNGKNRHLLAAEGPVLLCIGHSARDTFAALHRRGVPMEAKDFAVGFRVEHPQRLIDEAMVGAENVGSLPPSAYKLSTRLPDGRYVYSFCNCPGGFVLNASSQPGMTAVNGMSYAARDGQNANSAIVFPVTPADFLTAAEKGRAAEAASFDRAADPLCGMVYQMQLERAAFALGGGKIPQQLLGDYSQNVPSSSFGSFFSQTKGETCFSNLRGLFPERTEKDFIKAMEVFGQRILGFDREDTILSGVESRTSSPIRILRDENKKSRIGGLYPCGEGAGYAGGIVSAAVDGLRVAEAVIHEEG